MFGLFCVLILSWEYLNFSPLYIWGLRQAVAISQQIGAFRTTKMGQDYLLFLTYFCSFFLYIILEFISIANYGDAQNITKNIGLIYESVALWTEGDKELCVNLKTWRKPFCICIIRTHHGRWNIWLLKVNLFIFWLDSYP